MRRHMHVHDCAITCLSFDSLRVVTGATDGTICISGLVSGVLLQTLRGHPCKVLDLRVDRFHHVSASEDGSIRQWRWQARDGCSLCSKRYHILERHDLTGACSYRTSVASIREWNRIHDVTKLYLGQHLLVQKEVPDETDGDRLISPVLGKLALEVTAFH
ncbi:hypothetical protein H310_08835 [Aphanomyces invadans]|uniref:Uncharacterized protein n=1 Tax=Aphanomyces invadans TaxID=157072 RepID=A0A024TXL9_9STRA|nr:hypothetical protein H310_08835 [Aphanomyces invadans]ETV98768.1 hypothetical protein H310_08835 [Aphanomyces invadans]|eukprot:XP_008872965.1 hypothetical protein H310_08835 [Aphanomyces invadans]